MDSFTDLLEGKRVGDKFYRVNEDVMQADHNTARNVLARLFNPDIDRFLPYRQVKAILLKRTERYRLGLLNQDSSCLSVMALSTESE
jgi:predicted YcjX-like family ATPase